MELDIEPNVKQEYVHIKIEEVYFERIRDLTNIDDELLQSYKKHKCICCKSKIPRFSIDNHIRNAHKVELTGNGIKVSFLPFSIFILHLYYPGIPSNRNVKRLLTIRTHKYFLKQHNKNVFLGFNGPCNKYFITDLILYFILVYVV